MTEKLRKLMELNHVKSLKVQTSTNEELEDAIVELAENQAQIEDALVELAEIISEVE